MTNAPPRRRMLPTLAALATAGIALTGTAQAQGMDGWSFQITPYVWATGISGDITPFTGAPQVSFEASFSEVLEDLDAAFFLHGLARNGDFVLMFDLSYSASSREGLIPPGVPANGSLTQTSLTVAGGYRVANTPDASFDVFAGARAWWIEGAAEVPLLGASTSPSQNFVDPIIGARGHVNLAPDWSVTLYGDVGGFGVGSESTSQFFGTLNYAVTDQLTVSAGYRRLDVDYRSGGTVIDASMAGPLLGVTWAF